MYSSEMDWSFMMNNCKSGVRLGQLKPETKKNWKKILIIYIPLIIHFYEFDIYGWEEEDKQE